MNSDIRLPVTFRDHPKKERLKRALKLRLGPADILTNFWITVSQNRPEGVLTGWDDTDIAIAAKWDRDPSELVKVRIPVMANSDSGGSRTAVRTMANKSRSEATLFFKTSQNFSFKSI